MKLSAVFLLAAFCFSGTAELNQRPKDPEVRWIRSDTRATFGTEISVTDSLIDYYFTIDSSAEFRTVQGLVMDGPAFSQEIRVLDFSVVFSLVGQKDLFAFNNRGSFLTTDVMNIIKNANPGDYFYIMDVRLIGESGVPYKMKRKYKFTARL